MKTPAYYKDAIGNLHYLNEAGELTTVRRKMINIWQPDDGKTYNEAVYDLYLWGTECTQEEFDKAYGETMAKFNIAAGAVQF